jgi:hypothetical protein
MLTDKQLIEIYGQPGDEKNFTLITLPYPMRIAWDIKGTVKVMRCHKLVADRFNAVFKEILTHYGLPEIQRLGIDLFGGCVNIRTQRGSKTKWSRHAWGVAIDLSPEKNGLRTKWKDAQFSKPEYEKMIEIFYKHDFFSYGKELNFDAMHFETNK